VLSELQLYGYRPFHDEPDPRPLPEADAVADIFDALVSTLSDTRIEPDLADLLWSTVNLFHRAVDRIERELDVNEQAQRRSKKEQDGSEIRSVELEGLTAEGQSALARAACAYLFALMVVACAPEADRAKVEKLNRLIIDHVLNLLCARNPDARSLQLLFKLTARTVFQMSYDNDGDNLRRQWAVAEELPTFARALALWSSSALAEEDKALAAALFRRTAELPLSRGARGLQVSRMLTLLDLAVSASIEAGRQDLVRDLIGLWAEVYKDWQSIFPQWANTAETMAAANASRQAVSTVHLHTSIRSQVGAPAAGSWRKFVQDIDDVDAARLPKPSDERWFPRGIEGELGAIAHLDRLLSGGQISRASSSIPGSDPKRCARSSFALEARMSTSPLSWAGRGATRYRGASRRGQQSHARARNDSPPNPDVS
jgi:hypothetical protein